MKLLTSSIISVILWATIASAKWCANINQYDTTWDYSDRLQDLINEANRLR